MHPRFGANVRICRLRCGLARVDLERAMQAERNARAHVAGPGPRVAGRLLWQRREPHVISVPKQAGGATTSETGSLRVMAIASAS
jgi:hypothetical protein